MGDNWKVKHFNNDKLDCKIETHLITGDINVTGQITGSSNKLYSFIAPNPPTYMTSYYGSGHAYPNPDIAFDKTPNVGCVKTDTLGNFNFKLKSPGGYYIRMGTIYQPPHVMLYTEGDKDNINNIVLGEGVPYRPQTYKPPQTEFPRNGPGFYQNPLIKEKLRTQEQILRDSAYPTTNHWYKNFWGLKPPC